MMSLIQGQAQMSKVLKDPHGLHPHVLKILMTMNSMMVQKLKGLASRQANLGFTLQVTNTQCGRINEILLKKLCLTIRLFAYQQVKVLPYLMKNFS